MVKKVKPITTQDFQPDQPPQTAEYVPAVYAGASQSNYFRVPAFTLGTVPFMLADFRIRWGLWMLKGPILCKAKFFVKCDNAKAKEYLIKQITRFWRTSATRALKALEWGYSCSEAQYTFEDGEVHFDYLKDIASTDAFAWVHKGILTAAKIKNVPLQGKGKETSLFLVGPKKFWHVHNRETHPYYGCPRVFGAYMPWTEIWTEGGYRDSRRLYYYKYAMDGGGIYVPPGTSNVGKDPNTGNATQVPNMELGRQFVERKKAGGTWTLPGTTDDKGQRLWEVIPPSVAPPPTNIMEYGETLKDEEWEGMGIPPEIGRASGTGAFAGRIVPLMGFYTTLQELLYWLIHDADEQIFRPLVDHRFGKGIKYEIIPFSLMDEALKAEQEMGSGGGDISDEMGPPNLPQNPLQQGSMMGQYTEAEAKQLLFSALIRNSQLTNIQQRLATPWAIAV